MTGRGSSLGTDERMGQARPLCKNLGQEDVNITVIVSDVLG